MPRKDSLSERLIKWLFWIILVIYLFCGFYQIRYWLGESFGWDYNQENDALEIQGLGQILEAGSFLIVFLLLYGIYYLWKEASVKNHWESIFNNGKDYLKETKEAGVGCAKGVFRHLGTKSLWKNLFRIILIISIGLVPVLILGSLLSESQSFQIILFIGYGLIMLSIFLAGKND